MTTELTHAQKAALALNARAFRFSHTLGQHFLLDDNTLHDIVKRAEVMRGDNILEIGAGAGVLTAYLIDAGAQVLALEIDRALEDVYISVTGGRARLVFADVMRTDLDALISQNFGAGAVYSIVANLPYYITADFVLRALALDNKPARLTLMVQKEAAERMLSTPNHKNWCALAAIISYFARARALMDAPASLFTPPPHVDSRLIRLDVYAPDARPYKPIDENMLMRVINAAFRMRRKTLANNLTSAFAISRPDAEAALARAGVDARARGETLTLDALCAVSDALSGARGAVEEIM